jgi:hypothetical protein
MSKNRRLYHPKQQAGVLTRVKTPALPVRPLRQPFASSEAPEGRRSRLWRYSGTTRPDVYFRKAD